MAPMELATTRLDREEFSSTTKPHLLRDAARTYASRHLSGVCGARSIRNRNRGVKDAGPEFNSRRICLAIANTHLLPTPKFLLWTTREGRHGRWSRSGCG